MSLGANSESDVAGSLRGRSIKLCASTQLTHKTTAVFSLPKISKFMNAMIVQGLEFNIKHHILHDFKTSTSFNKKHLHHLIDLHKLLMSI